MKKSDVDSALGGIIWKDPVETWQDLQRTPSPLEGEARLVLDTSSVFLFDGTSWCRMSMPIDEEPDVVTVIAQLASDDEEKIREMRQQLAKRYGEPKG